MNNDGFKEVLGIWVGQAESSKFWLSILNELRNHSVSDVKVYCVDGLTGFKEAIAATFPKAMVQRCIIHQIRSSAKYVSYTDLKPFMADLKKIYGASSEEGALDFYEKFSEKWGKKYPSAVKSWSRNWDWRHSSSFRLKYARLFIPRMRLRRCTGSFARLQKTKAVFPTEQSLLILFPNKSIENQSNS